MINSLIFQLKNLKSLNNFKNVENILNNNIYDISIPSLLRMNYNYDNYDNKKIYYENIEIKNIEEKESYTKFLFFSSDICEAYFIYWKPNSFSRIHSHPCYGCYYTLLYNNIEEHIYNNNLEITDLNVLQLYDISYIDDNIGFHKMINNSKYPSLSLHIYSPPNSSIKYFD